MRILRPIYKIIPPINGVQSRQSNRSLACENSIEETNSLIRKSIYIRIIHQPYASG